MLRRLFLLSAAAATLGFTACGGEEGRADGTATATMSAQEYADRVDRLCGQAASGVLELGLQEKVQEIVSGPGTTEEKLDQIAPLFEQQLEVVSEFRRDVEALGRPPVGGDDVDQMLEKTRSAEDELARAIDAARDGDEDEFTDAAQRYAGFSSQSASIARDSELNFAICGAGA